MTDQIPRFSLQDQFGIRHAPPSLFGDRPLLILGGAGRRGEERIAAWASEVERTCRGQVDVIGIVDLHRVPFFMSRRLIHKHLRRSCPEVTLLCDWDGQVYRSLGLPGDMAGGVLYDRDGRLMGRLPCTSLAEAVGQAIA